MFPIPLIQAKARARALPLLVIGGHAVNNDEIYERVIKAVE